MKLRNKKTGEVVDTRDYNFKVATPAEPLYGHDAFDVIEEYNSLAELNEEWEDCNKPAEPLIKDEKIRKAVRAWAEANNAERVSIQNNHCLTTEDDEDVEIIFMSPIFKGIDDDDFYTIAELCGEEEE